MKGAEWQQVLSYGKYVCDIIDQCGSKEKIGMHEDRAAGEWGECTISLATCAIF